MKMKRFCISIALVLCFLIPTTPVRADDTTTAKIMASIGMLGYALASPVIAYPLALDADVWDALVDNLCPSVSSVEEQLRIIALSSTPKLKPTASQPKPELVSKTISNSYSQVISFGDSMSDNGNMFKVGTDLAKWGMPMPPNVGGRFSNGPVVIEIMSYILNKSLLNYAFGGAKSGYDSLIPAYGFNIGMLTEVDDFLGNLGLFKSADSKALYVIWTGPDDFYKGVNMFDATVASTVTSHIKTAMTKLYWRGARNFFVPLMPDLSITPAARIHATVTDGYLAAAHKRSVEMSSDLTTMLKSFAKQYPLAKVRTFDTFTVLTTEKQKYANNLGYNVTDACYTPAFMGLPGPVCDNPDDYLFWDGNHPTAWVSQIIGAYFADAAVGTPLPSR
jgi:phospholipase/lecithinase/hemolysin